MDMGMQTVDEELLDMLWAKSRKWDASKNKNEDILTWKIKAKKWDKLIKLIKADEFEKTVE